MRDTYTDADARFDAEALGRCGVCGREVSECGHCKECGRQGTKHAHTCSQHTVDHTVTDKTTGRMFNLTIQGGNSLIRLQEMPKDRHPPQWEDVPKTTLDGAMWWDQWSSEIDGGAFIPTRSPT